MEITSAFFPPVNAALNFTSGVLLVMGYRFIRRGNQRAHIRCMIAALTSSVLFLASYLTYHFVFHGMTRFAGPPAAKAVYLFILLTHTILATVILPMVIMTVFHAYRGMYEKHKRVARWTFPLWLYVSVTGVVIYVMLYILFPSGKT